ncbi:phosphoglycerol geranylgeranyltransferase [Salinimicrobium sediminilitoris]|uniref:geranylgeranylglyceryl/heptaprenylglyceryl phosphate synthase n=1 Tax=Salinimicrobium sediminilitoris TaxID=2876715 RepID=UPI001E59C3F5|nr:geranylgeranylglyceryl/heptaprenylglyceryl phosphate synthase [Salinimicrobium sediminilitoris]MCC8359257.1 geranylgeranylglyceryl/heptaprenylglyceryl phosphate synthase [Salinimicrobium sediminilitoris]
MPKVLEEIILAEKSDKRLLAVLIDPEKFDSLKAQEFLRKIPFLTTHIFIGGSTVTSEELENCTKAIKAETDLPVILFPGDHQQISARADALLFLSLLSGRNPDYLIEQQVRSVPLVRESGLEIIPTAYLLIDGGKECAVQRASRTTPLSQEDVQLIVDTALAGEYSGKQIIYLEAGSGAEIPVGSEIISAVKEAVQIPVIVGGGIRNRCQFEAAYEAGANMVVIGTAFEKGDFFL